MHKTYSLLLITGMIALLSLASCNNNTTDIPLPVNDSGYLQPVSMPLQFNAAKKLQWITVKTGGIKSVIKKLDIDALPSTPYDTTGFRPFAKPPEEVHFDFNTLPDTVFNLDNIAPVPLQFRTSVLAPAAFVKASPLSPKGGTTLSVIDIGKTQGLQEKIILCLLKDRNGFIWIGTNKGAYRFDGEYMQNYLPASQNIADLIEDNSGRIWYISGSGIGVIDPSHGTQRFSKKINAPFPKLPRMVLDDMGRIWVSQIGIKGVAIIDPQTQTYKHIDRSSGLPGTDTWGIFGDDKKNIWLTTNDGAAIINHAKGKISYLKKVNGLGSDTVRAITGDKKGRVWIAFQHGGVNEVDAARGIIKRYGKLQGFDNMLTYRLLYDDKDRVWMATDHGLLMADPERGVNRSFKERDGIPEDYVLDLLQDDKQRVWVATYSAGLSIVEQNAELVHPVSIKLLSTLLEDSTGKIWVGAGSSNSGIQILDKEKNIIRQLNKQHGLADNFIQNFMEVNGTIWIATDGGFDIIDLARKTIEHTGKKEGLTSDTIYAVIKDKAGNTWLTGPSQGVDMINAEKKIILHAGAEQGLSDENILDIKSDKQGKIWIATYRKGVDVIDPEKGTIQNLNQGPGLSDTCFRLLMPDEAGNMWIGTDKGVYIANTKQATLTSITTKEGLCNNYITSLISYKGTVVAGTRNKVSIITPPVTVNAAAIANSSDTLWKVGLLAGSEGLVNGSNNWSTNIITRKGQYLWGDAGITIINDIKEQNDSPVTYITGLNIMTQPQYFVKKPVLAAHDTLWSADSFYIRGQTPVNAGFTQQHGVHFDSVAGPYNMPVNLRIPYDQNYIQFQFAQHHSGRQDATLYSYVLQGIDKKWNAVTSNPFTENYLNLSAGNYTFRVRSKNMSGLWGKPASFSFTITPPWWQTWWAYTLFALLCIGVLRAYIVYRSRKLQRENKLLEEKVNLRTSQLQKSLEDLKATQSQLIQSEKMASLGELTAGIAHEIQNPLNFINNFSDVNTELIADMKDEINKGNMEEVKAIAGNIEANEQKINHHGRRADSIVKGMLQHSRTGSRQKEATNINVLADEYFRLAYHGLRAKDKSFNATMKTDFNEGAGNISVIPQDIGRVILNLITNAFYAVTERKKQHPDGYEPTVWVSTKKSDGKVLISVKDNGNGIPQKVLDKIFQPFFTTKPTGQGTGLGLSLSYDIIKAHGGSLKAATKEGEFAEFVITLPV